MKLDERVHRLREAVRDDPRIAAALLYGSWTTGEADEHSDIEAYMFLAPGQKIEPWAFAEQIAPVRLCHTNMFGVHSVIFDDLMRGEFHFDPVDEVDKIEAWQGMVHLPDPDGAVLVDRDGRLTELARELGPVEPPSAETAQVRADELANWTLMVSHLLARGEAARAAFFLNSVVSPHQLQLLRLLHGSTDHWLTPSRALEEDLPSSVERHAATTAPAEPAAVARAARESWEWSRELVDEAHGRWGTSYDAGLHADIAAHLVR
ncbi:nucleotidyltransferase domain-containing protein [Nocardiopsis salina]|uniref:nucleotidyltransferase domain-containing protein n=1 Tax=Nocardiopsis salina TaxID=245836 RepID=UPI00034A9371|nr:nucleotidyltransferase domain-containing protein [Nocardiopsis salina]